MTILQEAVEKLSEEEGEIGTVANTAGILTQFLAEGHIPVLRDGARIDPNEAVVYEQEFERLPSEIRKKFHELTKLSDKLHHASAAEAHAEKGLTDYIENQEKTYGKLESRVQVVERKAKLFAQLELEVEEIKRHGNISAYEKQGRSTAPTGIDEEQVKRLNMELAD